MAKKIHVVPHSHWDREWYFTTSRSKVYLMKDLKDVLDTLENKDAFRHWILDGQASLLDDYLKWRPQDKERIKKLVKTGKLIIGPWYTQTDQLVISGESIVRNMQYGMEICAEFGDYMNVGYMPDSFGQSSSMPQIYQEFGIEDTLFWRGVSDDEVAKTEFLWEGEDGSVVNAYQIPSGYYIGGPIPEDDEGLKNLINLKAFGDSELMRSNPFSAIIKRASTDHVYFPNGFDQAPIRSNLPELVERMNHLIPDCQFEISTIEKYIQGVKSEKPVLEKVQGELVNGKLMRIHKTIFSSRPDLKALNTQCQNYLVNVLEPLLVIADSLGFEYPAETMKEIWKLMFENAAHDSIGSCVSDTTNEDVYMRYKKVRDISSNLAELTMREIATRIEQTNDNPLSLTVFNPLPESYSGIIETEIYLPQEEFAIVDGNGKKVPYSILSMEDQTDYVLGQTIQLNPSKTIYRPDKVYKAKIALDVKNIPSFGYKQLTMDLSDHSLVKMAEKAIRSFETDDYSITIQENGSLDILDKSSGYLYKGQGIIEENGDGGDSFNYSPPPEDMVISTKDARPDIQVVQSSLETQLSIKYLLAVPQNLAERKQKQCSAQLPVNIQITFKQHQPVIDYTVEIDNIVDSHRICLLFDTGIASRFSIADGQFNALERPVYCEKEMALWHEQVGKWNEMPISIETCQSFVSLNNGKRGMAVFPKGVREYEIIGSEYDTIRITLMRTYGAMGKEDLLYRPGRASGETIIATPDAQLKKKLRFHLATYYHNGTFDQGEVAKHGKAANTHLPVYQYADFLNGRLIFCLADTERTLPTEYSLFKVEGNAVTSILKKAEDGTGYILRLYNALLDHSASAVLTNLKQVKELSLVNLKEEEKEKLTIQAGSSAEIGMDHAQFKTIKLTF